VASTEYQAVGNNASAPFTLKAHRGDGMVLLAMNWRQGTPPDDFVGFGIEYQEPGQDRWWQVKNRLTFPGVDATDANERSTLRSPIQKFRWVHFPRNPELKGEFTYRVTPIFMTSGALNSGQSQEVEIELARETYPDQLNVAYTRGFVSSQAFVDRYGSVSKLIPAQADRGLKFVPTHPKAEEAYKWMGFEARDAIINLLEDAVNDQGAQVRVVAYDLNLPEVVDRLAKLKSRLKIIIDNSGKHGADESAETQAAARLVGTAGVDNVRRQHVGHLQHNKTIVVDGAKKQALCGSTNLSWRGFYVQSNNAVIVQGADAIKPFAAAFDEYWQYGGLSPASAAIKGFGATKPPGWTSLKLAGVNAKATFSPHVADNARLDEIADDIGSTTSTLLYSLAFLYETPGPILDRIKAAMENAALFVFGISDRKVGGLNLGLPDGNVDPVYPSQLAGEGVPEPFKSEPSGGSGARMHHKFVVIDFDKPTARVYLGSYNFSGAADTQNGENLLLIRDRRVATSYAVQALSIFDHWEFRVVQADAKKRRKKLELQVPPKPGKPAWWAEDYTDPRKIKDRLLFSA
jgi:phosphatidylserine/phosphatidylglycerophosphate/cardiolipin synthase-like enzyme